MNTHYVC